MQGWLTAVVPPAVVLQNANAYPVGGVTAVILAESLVPIPMLPEPPLAIDVVDGLMSVPTELQLLFFLCPSYAPVQPPATAEESVASPMVRLPSVNVPIAVEPLSPAAEIV